MSLVILLMSTPAFSLVKKSSDSRCRWENPLQQGGGGDRDEVEPGDESDDGEVLVTG
jgi:hypothetical protein